MKKPEEIKKGLACCLGDYHDYHCEECPYDCETDGMDLANDTLALIQQLEAQNAELVQKSERAAAGAGNAYPDRFRRRGSLRFLRK